MKIIVLIFLIFNAHLLIAKETTLLLIRHGQTDWNISDRAQGHTNNPLNDQGLIQAKKLAEKILLCHPDVSFIYSSDLDRAYVTALETARKLGLDVEKSDCLREINNGEAEGLTLKEEDFLYGVTLKELNQRYPNLHERWDYTHIPNAETNNQLLQRIKNKLLVIATAHLGEKIAVFTHGEIIKVFISDILQEANPPLIPNCAIVHIVFSSNSLEHPFRLLNIE